MSDIDVEDTSKEDMAFLVKLPLTLYDKLEECAKTNRRSLNNEIIIGLYEYYNLQASLLYPVEETPRVSLKNETNRAAITALTDFQDSIVKLGMELKQDKVAVLDKDLQNEISRTQALVDLLKYALKKYRGYIKANEENK